MTVDGSTDLVNLYVPQNAGPEFVRGGSTYIWDCKLDSILSRLINPAAAGPKLSGGEIEFFCRLKWTPSWFFDIYIQGSKKVQL